MSLCLSEIIIESAKRFPDETALINNEERISYRDLRKQVLSVAAYLKSIGVGRGDTVALMCGNMPEFTIAYFGVLASGATLVTLNSLLVADEIAYQLENSQSVGVISEAESLEAVLEGASRAECCEWIVLADRIVPAEAQGAQVQAKLGDLLEKFDPLQRCELTNPDDTAVILYTSGTTGHPKGAELTHFNLWENARQISERLFAANDGEISLIGPGHVAIAALPLYHTFGQTCVQNALLTNGGAVTYLKRFDPEDCAKIIARDRVTILDAVPTIYTALLHCDSVDPSSLQCLSYGVSGGAALPLEVRSAFEAKFKMELQEGYGLTETSPVASAQVRWRERKIGSIGCPIEGVEMKIFDDDDNEVSPGSEGEVVIRGRNIMKGYLNQPEATAKVMRNGWFHSGDVGKMDEEGHFYIVDRKKDMIIRGGYNVYPREVEEVLYAHPDIAEACVIGVPDEKYGEEVKAVVTLMPSAKTAPEEIVEYCKKHVAAYKYPRVVEVVAEIPKGPTGKILKREVRRIFTDAKV